MVVFGPSNSEYQVLECSRKLPLAHLELFFLGSAGPKKFRVLQARCRPETSVAGTRHLLGLDFTIPLLQQS